MKLIEDEIKRNYGKKCGNCYQNMLLPYEYEWSCFGCEYNVVKRKQELSKFQIKKNLINRLKYAERKIFCICVDVYKNYEGNDYDKIYEIFSTLKNKTLKMNNILIEKYKNMLEKPDFEQNR